MAVRQPRQPGPIQQADTAARKDDQPLPFEILQLATDNLPGGPQLGRQLLVGNPQFIIRTGMTGEVCGKAGVEPAESDRLDQGYKAAEMIAEGGEYKSPEGVQRLHSIIEVTGWNGQRSHPGFGDTLGRVATVAEQAGRGQHTGITRAKSIEHDFATVLCTRHDLHTALDHQQVIATPVTLVKNRGFLGQTDLVGIVQQRLHAAGSGGFPGQLRKDGMPVSFHSKDCTVAIRFDLAKDTRRSPRDHCKPEACPMRLAAAVLLLLVLAPLQADVVGKAVTYTADGTVMNGYLAWDNATDSKRPGILVVHEWWGHNDYARKRAEMLAKLGYTALAVDMYGDGKTAGHPEDAGKFAGAVRKNLDLMQARFNAARTYLNSHPTVDPEKNAAIGYCFGGSVVLSMARAGADLDGVVSFHGSLGGLPPVNDTITAKVLVANGADDSFISAESIAVFRDDMDVAGADYTFIDYPGAKHSFTNPGATRVGEQFGLPLEYNAAADKASWQAMLDFFNTLFR